MKKRGAVRSYAVAPYPNAGKSEAARYAIWWQTRCCLDYVRELHGDAPNAKRSTVGLGELPERGLKRARDILRAGRAAERATGIPFECPTTAPVLADARVHAVGVIHRDEEREEGREPMCLGCGHISPCPTRLALAHFAPSK